MTGWPTDLLLNDKRFEVREKVSRVQSPVNPLVTKIHNHKAFVGVSRGRQGPTLRVKRLSWVNI